MTPLRPDGSADACSRDHPPNRHRPARSRSPGIARSKREAWRIGACSPATRRKLARGRELLEKAHRPRRASKRRVARSRAVQPTRRLPNHAVEGLLLETHLPDHLPIDSSRRISSASTSTRALARHQDRWRNVPGVPRGHSWWMPPSSVWASVSALLRGVLFDPAGSDSKAIGIYSLMHLIEDSTRTLT